MRKEEILAMQKGFTLLEGLVAMVIIAVGLLATAQLLIVNIQNNKKSEVRLDSSAMVKSMLDEAAVAISVEPAKGSGLTKADNCKANMLTAPVFREYMGRMVEQKVSCKEILGPLNEQQERYMLTVQIIDELGQVVAKGSNVVTTVVSSK